MHVDTEAVCFVILPISFVDVTVSVAEFPVPVSLVLVPEAFVARAILPHLNARALTLTIAQVALVNGTILEGQLIDEGHVSLHVVTFILF